MKSNGWDLLGWKLGEGAGGGIEPNFKIVFVFE